jgi:opacity protein-like surface antigen
MPLRVSVRRQLGNSFQRAALREWSLKRCIHAAQLAVLAMAALWTGEAQAQAAPTAIRTLDLSAVGGGSGVYTGLQGGKNLSITAGVDLTIRTFFGLRPSVEIRGTYPVDDNGINNEKNVVGGLKIAKDFRRLHPYGDVLFGRGAINYIHGALNPSDTVEYLENPTNVLSPGAGVDLDVTQHFALKADAQYQRYDTPVTTSGTLYAKALTLGVVYHLNFDRRHRSR